MHAPTLPAAPAGPSVGDLVAELVDLFERHHRETARHSLRVAQLSFETGVRLGLTLRQLVRLYEGALLHDLGKLTLPRELLDGDRAATAADWQLLRRHPEAGARMIAGDPPLRAYLGVVRSHHERWLAQGYPDALAGAQIPFEARIVAVCDSFDAMTCMRRSYRPPVSVPDALAELGRLAGTAYDPLVVRAFMSLWPEARSGLAPRPGMAQRADASPLAA